MFLTRFQTVDRLLELSEEADRYIDFLELKKKYGDEQFKYEGTPLAYVLSFIDEFNPSEKDIIYDLGCGYGRVVIHGALACPAKFIGIEIVEDRVKTAQSLISHMELENAEIKPGNVSSMDISDGTIFFLFNPFKVETLEKIGSQLKKIAQNHQIKIATWGGPSNEFFKQCDWLEHKQTDLIKQDRLDYFISKK